VVKRNHLPTLIVYFYYNLLYKFTAKKRSCSGNFLFFCYDQGKNRAALFLLPTLLPSDLHCANKETPNSFFDIDTSQSADEYRRVEVDFSIHWQQDRQKHLACQITLPEAIHIDKDIFKQQRPA